jgi:glycosidase
MLKKTFAKNNLKAQGLLGILLLCASFLSAQVISVDPNFPTIEDVITITYDASQGNGELTGVSPVYGHMGLITEASASPTDWQFVQGEWGTDDSNVMLSNLGNNLHQITVDIDQFYGIPQGLEVLQLAFVFRSADGSLVGRAEDGSDIYYDIYPVGAELQVSLLSPGGNQIVEMGDELTVSGVTSIAANLSILLDGLPVASESNTTSLTHIIEVTTPGTHEVTFEASVGGSIDSESFFYTVLSDVQVQDPPADLKDGINYTSSSSMILQLHAPNKEFVYVIGDFNDWMANEDYFMTRASDQETWWLQIDGLVPGQRYAYQYWVDGEIKVADPLSPLILDPYNDQGIPTDVYPNPHPYPAQLTSGFCTVSSPGAEEYNWVASNYTRPEKKDLIIYEVLVRDFLADHSYMSLIDTLDYLENLGVNAIELMPPGEFEGNESWGYNPSFHMALDKYYGTPEMFKQFVDACHQRDIAVIVDIVLNHAFGQSPLAHLYWEGNGPAANNPWLNTNCPHPPYCWGSDFDHASIATQRFIDRVNSYWIEEYKVDGFRFDFTGGFSNNPPSNYDASRIGYLERMADQIWDIDPTAYVILEHWQGNQEEEELSEYGDGMMLWGNVTYNYQEAAMGYTPGSNFEWGIYLERGWSNPHLVTYMESHDEERVSFKTLSFGNSEGDYNTQDLLTAMSRNDLNAVFFLSQPGPKMIWQFGELGYDISIDYDCRVCPKPILWNYYTHTWRKRTYDVYSAMTWLRRNYGGTFNTTAISHNLGGAFKRINLFNIEMDAVVIGNFGVEPISGNANIPYTGVWHDYFSGESLDIQDVSAQILLAPGEFRVYTSEALETPEVQVGIGEFEELNLEVALWPTPAAESITLSFDLKDGGALDLFMLDAEGRIIQKVLEAEKRSGAQHILLPVEGLAAGQYHVLLAVDGVAKAMPWIKQ